MRAHEPSSPVPLRHTPPHRSTCNNKTRRIRSDLHRSRIISRRARRAAASDSQRALELRRALVQIRVAAAAASAPLRRRRGQPPVLCHLGARRPGVAAAAAPQQQQRAVEARRGRGGVERDRALVRGGRVGRVVEAVERRREQRVAEGGGRKRGVAIVMVCGRQGRREELV